MLYYICAMHTFFTWMVYLALYVGNQFNENDVFCAAKILVTLAITAVLYDVDGVFQTVMAPFGGILAFHEPQFVRHLPGFYPLFVDLMHCDSKELRQILRDIFSQRIGTVLHERQQAL